MNLLLQKTFGLDPAKHSIKTEIIAGLTTFLTMAYILAVNPNIFSELASKGMPTEAVFTATALAAIVGCLVSPSMPRNLSDLLLAWVSMPFSFSPYASAWRFHGSWH